LHSICSIADSDTVDNDLQYLGKWKSKSKSKSGSAIGSPSSKCESPVQSSPTPVYVRQSCTMF
jgi:hypothetical protein